jgi:hypothetical protein
MIGVDQEVLFDDGLFLLVVLSLALNLIVLRFSGDCNHFMINGICFHLKCITIVAVFGLNW